MKRRSHGFTHGFTLIEALVALVLVSIGMVAVFGGIRSLGAADSKAKTALFLQQLAMNKFNEMQGVTDPTTAGNGGDFTDEGYPDVSWTLDLETTATTNLDKMTITVKQGKEQQTLAGLTYIPPTTSTSALGSATP